MPKILQLYFWMGIATLSNFLVILIYTDYLNELYFIVASILIIQSLATTLDFGFNSLLMRKAIETNCIDNKIYSLLTSAEIILTFVWILISIVFVEFNLNAELSENITHWVLYVCFFFIPLSRILSQFQRTLLYSRGQHTLATKSLALSALIKLALPIPFMSSDAVYNATIYISQFTVISILEYIFLKHVNFRNKELDYQFLYPKNYYKKNRTVILSLIGTSLMISMSTQVEKNTLFNTFDFISLTQITHVLQISALILIVFGPISQLIQPEIIRNNLSSSQDGLKSTYHYLLICTIIFISIVKIIEYLLVSYYELFFNTNLDETTIWAFRFFSFLSVIHIQSSITYFYNIGRNKLLLQAPGMAAQLSLDFLALYLGNSSFEFFIILFCSFRLLSYIVFFYVRYIGELNFVYAKIFLLNIVTLIILI